jgi:hypothetical protein
MSQDERRSTERCPVCQGAMKADPKMKDGWRCRTSVCAFNHSGIKCPRCQSSALEHIQFLGTGYKYTCSDCLQTFQGETISS